jgi:hypothetical protein
MITLTLQQMHIGGRNPGTPCLRDLDGPQYVLEMADERSLVPLTGSES